MPADHDGFDDVGGKECQREETADLVGGETLLAGDVIDACFVASGKFLEPGMSLGDCGNEDMVEHLGRLLITDDQPCFDAAPPE